MSIDDVARNKNCYHEPNQLYPIGSEYDDDEVIYLFRCKCGKEVAKHFQFMGTEVLE